MLGDVFGELGLWGHTQMASLVWRLMVGMGR